MLSDNNALYINLNNHNYTYGRTHYIGCTSSFSGVSVMLRLLSLFLDHSKTSCIKYSFAGFTSIDNNVGYFGITIGPSAQSHLSSNKFMIIQQSSFVGSSSTYDCSSVFTLLINNSLFIFILLLHSNNIQKTEICNYVFLIFIIITLSIKMNTFIKRYFDLKEICM